MKTYPKGKGASVSTAFEDNKFILPTSKRDEYGELEEPNNKQDNKQDTHLNFANNKQDTHLNFAV